MTNTFKISTVYVYNFQQEVLISLGSTQTVIHGQIIVEQAFYQKTFLASQSVVKIISRVVYEVAVK
jgi:hypothetical protein